MTASSGGDLEALLTPSLGARSGANSLYSVRASFFVAFFGGPVAALIFGFLNSRRLGREREDGWLYGVIALPLIVLLVWLGYAASADELPAWLGTTKEASSLRRFLPRALALLIFGGIYLRLRPFFKAAELSGQPAPDPWRPGLVTVAAATAINVAAAGAGVVLAG